MGLPVLACVFVSFWICTFDKSGVGRGSGSCICECKESVKVEEEAVECGVHIDAG